MSDPARRLVDLDDANNADFVCQCGGEAVCLVVDTRGLSISIVFQAFHWNANAQSELVRDKPAPSVVI